MKHKNTEAVITFIAVIVLTLALIQLTGIGIDLIRKYAGLPINGSLAEETIKEIKQ